MSPVPFLREEFGYVMLCVVYAIVHNIYLAVKVGRARKQYDIQPPALYSEKQPLFNCIQRAHQNYIEQLPVFFALLIVVGLAYPIYAAICGAIFVTGRFSYARGYYTGDPEKRLNGSYGMIGFFGLLLGVVYVGIRQLGFMDKYLIF